MTYKGKGTFIERDKTAHKVVVDAQGRDSRGNGTASAKATLTMSEAGSGQTKVTVLTEMQVTGKPAQFGRGVMADVGDKILGQFASCLADEFADAPAPAASASSSAASSGNGAAPAASSGAAPVSGDATPVSQPAAPAPVSAGSGAPEAAPMASTVAQARTASDTAAKPGGSPASGAGPQPVSQAPRSESPERPKRQQAEAIDLLDASGGALMKRVVPVAAGVGVLALILLIIRLARR
jgi:hypothetical protein